MKKVKEFKGLALDKYVNTDTGETLASELGKGHIITIAKDTDKAIVEYEEFLTIDITTLNLLQTKGVLRKQDYFHLVTLFTTLKGEHNAMYNHTVPHTLQTLSTKLELNYNDTCTLIKRFRRANIIYLLVTAEETIYCMNPYLSKRRRTVSTLMLSIFNKFFVHVKGSKTKLEIRLPVNKNLPYLEKEVPVGKLP